MGRFRITHQKEKKRAGGGILSAASKTLSSHQSRRALTSSAHSEDVTCERRGPLKMNAKDSSDGSWKLL